MATALVASLALLAGAVIVSGSALGRSSIAPSRSRVVSALALSWGRLGVSVGNVHETRGVS